MKGVKVKKIKTLIRKALPEQLGKSLKRLLYPEGSKISRNWLLEILPKNSVGIEIGVHKGDFSALILDIVKPSKLHLADPWKYEESEIYSDAWYGGAAKGGQSEMDGRYESVMDRFDSLINADRIEVHRENSQDIAGNFSQQYFDWVYIDGNHLYEYAKQDLENYFEKLKIGGYLTGDDYVDGNWWGGGVKKAVDEFVKNFNVQVVEIKNEQFVLKKIGS